jgi:transcription termination/antitermination protein NusA
MSELKAIIKQICAEKGLPEESVYETINAALAAAYRKDFGDKDQNTVAEYDVVSGDLKVFDEKTVVENLTKDEIKSIEKLQEMRDNRKQQMEETGKVVEKTDEEITLEEETRKFNPKTEIELKDAQKIKKSYKIDDIIRTPLEVPGDFGRMAAQTAKQVIIQKLREAEREIIFDNYKDREGEVIYGIVQKRDGRNVIIDLDNVTALMPPNEQIRTERYNLGDRLKIVLLKVELTNHGPEIIVSRTNPIFVQKLFETEIPEIASGVIEIKGIAREAGSRSKISVHTEDSNIDPIGSCIGQRGARIQTIINELNGEKIDIIEYSDDPVKYITNSLMPAKITSVELNEEEKTALVTVPADQLSLTIGREGQNVRLAVKLTDWKINIKEQESGKEIKEEEVEPVEEKKKEKKEKKAKAE